MPPMSPKRLNPGGMVPNAVQFSEIHPGLPLDGGDARVEVDGAAVGEVGPVVEFAAGGSPAYLEIPEIP